MPHRAAWLSKGDLRSLKFLLYNNILSVDDLLLEVMSTDAGDLAKPVKWLLEQGPSHVNADFIKKLFDWKANVSTSWRRFGTPAAWATLFRHPNTPVDILINGNTLLQTFVSLGKTFALEVGPVLAARGLDPDVGPGRTVTQYCTSHAWYDVIDALTEAYCPQEAARAGLPQSSAAVAVSGGANPALENVVRALVDLAVKTNKPEDLAQLRAACSAFGWTV